MSEPKYPYVDCDVHGTQLGVASCGHVMSGELPAILQEPTEQSLGAAVCSVCCNFKLPDLYAIGAVRLICQTHFNERPTRRPGNEA